MGQHCSGLLGALCSSGGWGRGWGQHSSGLLGALCSSGGGGEGGGETMSVWQSMWAGLRRSIDTVS